MRAVLGFVILSLVLPRAAAACSMCRCSDPVFSALGEGLYTYGGFQVALDWTRLDQSQGAGPDLEEQVRNSVVATLSYGWRERLTFVAQVPYTFNHLTEGEDVETADGMGDPAFYLYVRLWSSKFNQGLGRRAWISAVVGVKTPWGKNDVTADGERLDEHVQPGTGATNLVGGLSGLYLLDEKSSMYASVAYTGTGRNDFGYKYGDNVQANLVYERKLTEWLDGVVELNFLDAKHDQVDAPRRARPRYGRPDALHHAARGREHRPRPRRPRGRADPGVGEPERDPGREARVHRGADVRVLGGAISQVAVYAAIYVDIEQVQKLVDSRGPEVQTHN